MNELQIKGTQKFMGKEIPVVEGGFGEGKRCLTDKTIAEIHGMQPKNVRARITDNLKRFKENIDVIDLKRAYDTSTLIELGYAKQSITQAEHIYLLSERGYAKLIKIMDTDLAWDIHDKLMDEYFAMREVINSSEQLKAMALLKAVESTGEESIVAIKQYTDLRIQEETRPLLDKIENDKPLVEFAETISQTVDSISIGDFAKLVKDEGIKLGRNKLFNWLRDNKYLMKNNVPYQKYIDNGYFELIEYSYKTPYGEKLTTKTLITGLGQIKIIEKLRNNN